MIVMEEKVINRYGFVPSKIDGTEYEFKEDPKWQIPERYTVDWVLPDVINQGSRPICVPCSISAWLNWDINLANDVNKVDNRINLQEIYDCRTDGGDNGMTFKEAFHFLRHIGVGYQGGIKKIGRYCKIGSVMQLKQAIVANGPCFGALRVYNDSDAFWLQGYNDKLQGGHAIAIVGYDTDGFIIRNSWGKSFGDKGYTHMPYEDFDSFLEIWTIVE